MVPQSPQTDSDFSLPASLRLSIPYMVARYALLTKPDAAYVDLLQKNASGIAGKLLQSEKVIPQRPLLFLKDSLLLESITVDACILSADDMQRRALLAKRSTPDRLVHYRTELCDDIGALCAINTIWSDWYLHLQTALGKK